jgi:hypothetical protein
MSYKTEFNPRDQNCTVQFLFNDPLPEELRVHIFGFLPYKALEICKCVCKQWSEFAAQDLFWKRFVCEAGITEKLVGITYYNFYKRITTQEWFLLFDKKIASKENLLTSLKIQLSELISRLKIKSQIGTSVDQIKENRINKLNSQTLLLGSAYFYQGQMLFNNLKASNPRVMQNNFTKFKNYNLFNRIKQVKEDIAALKSLRSALRTKLVKGSPESSIFMSQLDVRTFEFFTTVLKALEKKEYVLSSHLNSWPQNKPEINAAMIFLTVAWSGSLFFLKDLLRKAITRVPTQQEYDLFQFDLLSYLLKDKNYAMLHYCLELEIKPKRAHLEYALKKLDCKSVELLLTTQVPIRPNDFINFLEKKRERRLKLPTLEHIQIFKSLCQTISRRKQLPDGWEKCSALSATNISNIWFVYSSWDYSIRHIRNQIDHLKQKDESSSARQMSKIYSRDDGHAHCTYENAIKSIRGHREGIQTALKTYPFVLELLEAMEKYLPNGFIEEMKASGLTFSQN